MPESLFDCGTFLTDVVRVIELQPRWSSRWRGIGWDFVILLLDQQSFAAGADACLFASDFDVQAANCFPIF